MKTTLLAFLLLFAFTTQPLLLIAAEATPEPVIDTTGKKLRADSYYHIVPAVPFTICGSVSCSTGGGLALDKIDDSCPLDVVIKKAYQGLQMRLTPVNTKKGVIRVSTDLNIGIADVEERCPQFSRVWKLGDFDASIGQTFVTTGGVVGNPGAETILNWFKIEKYEDAYKLVYCPSVCPSCNHLCKDLGMFVDGNKRMRLALSDVAFKIKFHHQA